MIKIYILKIRKNREGIDSSLDSPEFTREAVQVLESVSRPASQIARELGIKRNQLYTWQKELKARGIAPFSGS